MRVLHIIWSSNIGGIESVVLNLSIAQQKNNFVKQVIYACKSERQEEGREGKGCSIGRRGAQYK